MLRSTRSDPSPGRSSALQASHPRWPSTRARAQPGFTLIELMIVVAILGVLTAIAIPAFRTVVYRAKTAEAPLNLNMLYKGAASYYNSERSTMGQNGQQLLGCAVGDSIGTSPATPGVEKQAMPNTDPAFRALAFKPADLVYYAYGVETSDPGGASTCGGAPNRAAVYTFYAHGDLDGDAITSNFELAVGSDGNNELFHSRGVYIANELE